MRVIAMQQVYMAMGVSAMAKAVRGSHAIFKY